MWEPISTAPLGGRHVLLYRPHIQFVGYYGGANSGWHHNAYGYPLIWPLPTHWAELIYYPKILRQGKKSVTKKVRNLRGEYRNRTG